MAIKSLKNAACIVAMWLIPSAVFASVSFSTYFRAYLAKLESAKSAVLYSECARGKRGRALLLFPIGEHEGLLAEIADDSVVNLSRVATIDGKIIAGETEGGVWTLSRVQMLADQLVREKFTLLLPGRLSSILASTPELQCKDTDP